jgi:ubiquinone/menaquinone biosynthesis C-methylase UbiE
VVTLEKNDFDLKEKSRNWWSRHSQDYVDAGETPYLGVDTDMNDDDFLNYLEGVDRNFDHDAYFAHVRDEPMFSRLMPIDWLPGKKVLEVGCGLGTHSEILCRAGAVLAAVDLSPTSVEVTQRRLSLKGFHAEVSEADAERLPFESQSFDYVWSWGVIHHSPDTIVCAKEISRILKPGGRLGIMIYNKNSMFNWINVILGYGVFRGKLLAMGVQELRNRYTDGKEVGGAPLVKYFTRKIIRTQLFPELEIVRQTAFEQKKAVSFFLPIRWRRNFERMIPDGLYTWIWSRLGFLIFTEGRKP